MVKHQTENKNNLFMLTGIIIEIMSHQIQLHKTYKKNHNHSQFFIIKVKKKIVNHNHNKFLQIVTGAHLDKSNIYILWA